IIDIAVKVGDTVAEEDGLITLETDKAAMDVPSPVAGKIVDIKVSLGDKVSKGSLIMVAEVGATDAPANTTVEPVQAEAPQKPQNKDVEQPTKTQTESRQQIVVVPDL